MEKSQSNTLLNFGEPKTDILKKRLLQTTSISAAANLAHSQQNVILNTVRAPISSSMIVSSVQAPQSSMPITHNLVTHSIAPVKLHPNTSPYPLQLSTVHVPVQIPGSTSNINIPVQLTGATSSVPLHLATPSVSLPLQVSGTTSVPVHLPAGETLSVPLQFSGTGQNIQLTGSALPSMPLLHNTSQSLHSSIIHVHMGSNPRTTNLDGSSEMNVTSSSQLQLTDASGVQVKMNNPVSASQVQMASNSTVVQIPNVSNNSIQLTLPSSGNHNTVQLRGAQRPVPHVVYIQTSTGLKPVTSSEVISQASSSGNPPQIIVRRPVTSTGNIHLISNVTSKTNIPTKMTLQNKSSLLAPANVSQPIVIQKPKGADKMIVPVSISSGGSSKQAIAYLGPVKKTNSKPTESQSILIQNNQANVNTNSNQKLFLTPMAMPKMPNTKFILPVTLPATMASKGPIINLQIANGQIQNDPQGNITVMRDNANTMETSDMPPLQPLGKVTNGKDNSASVPQGPKSDKAYAVSITGSRAESTGEHEYTLSIPETNASMNDDIYTVSIADEDGAQREKSFTLAIPEKGKSLLNRNLLDRSDMMPVSIPAPAILRRSNSDNSERKTANANLKRRISLCNENISNKNFKLALPPPPEKPEDIPDTDNNDDHRVPSLFCDEKLDKDLEAKVLCDSDHEDRKESKNEIGSEKSKNDPQYYSKMTDDNVKKDGPRVKSDSVDWALEEDPPGLMWNNGVAQLQGSSLQFQTNEFGLIDIIDGSDHEDSFINHNAKYNTPLKQRIDRSGREKKPTSPEDLYRCDGCGCHGMAAEFVTPNFCSLTCKNDFEKTLQKKRDRERAELTKKRNKIKKLLLRKPHSDIDLILESRDDKALQKQCDASLDTRLSDAGSVKNNDDFIENEKYPWMCGKNGFSWMRYLEFCKAKAAPVKLFKDPFPYNRNGFKVSMRLEAIDPQHPSYFCVVSVAEVQGYRMRLHFDDYPDMYDYWVNADCIDIFPPGWCDKNGRTLRAPASCTGVFSWPLYLKQVRAIAAPRHLFPHLSNTMVRPNGFRTGMKLEAEDRKNNLVCVATIADMMDNRMLVNFDSWDEMYDYWVDPASPYIHPVGWAEENDISLTPPNFYKDPDSFSWENYLTETGASAAPARAFKTRQPAGFKIGMKLEVVDRRIVYWDWPLNDTQVRQMYENVVLKYIQAHREFSIQKSEVPFLIRVATINEVKGHQVRISFDGWPDELSCWMDDDSPDIHPVGWCLKTGHPLEPPLTAEELRITGPCGVGGCRGLGSLHGGAHKQHNAASACPYRPKEPPTLPDRLARAGDQALPRTRKVLARQSAKSTQASTPTSDAPREKGPRVRPPKHKRLEEITKTEPPSDDESVSSSASKRWRHSSAVAAAVEARVTREYCARSGEKALGAVPRVQHHIEQLALPAEPTHWTQSDVTAFVSRLAGAAAGAAASAARLSGRSLLMASREELVECARMRLGPAIKVHAAVRQLRAQLT